MTEDGVEVELETKLGVVVEARHDDAHWQFLLYFGEFEFLADLAPVLLLVFGLG